MDENDFAELDETFFALMDGLFSRGFSALADDMLAGNEAEEKAAAIRRHPSARRRF
jgi:hypothetical protein